jgi:hypothetical protein
MADLSEVFGDKALTYAEFQEAAKGAYVPQADFEALQSSYNDLQGKVTAFDTTKNDLTAQIDTLKTEIKTRDETAKQAAFEAAVSGRFKAITKDVKFANEITEKAIFGDFLSAVSDTKNAGKPDGEVSVIRTESEREGISNSTLYETKKKLGIISEEFDKIMYWSIPKNHLDNTFSE